MYLEKHILQFNILHKIQAFILLSVPLISGCTDLSWKPPDPGTVIAQLSNLENSLSALVIATKDQGVYIFEVRTIEKQNFIKKKTISAPVGYHEHRIKLKWINDGQTVSATIDHDFGEGNKVFEINIIDKGL